MYQCRLHDTVTDLSVCLKGVSRCFQVWEFQPAELGRDGNFRPLAPVAVGLVPAIVVREIHPPFGDQLPAAPFFPVTFIADKYRFCRLITLSYSVCHLPPLTLFSKSVANIRSVQIIG